jgi:predicted nucleic acid-binding protein
MTQIKRVYWDACVFIKHLSPKSDPKTKSILDGIDEVVAEAEAGRTVIITSSITRIEVLDCKIPLSGEALYLKFLRREIVQEYDVDPRIGNAAHDIRVFYQQKGHTLSVADSIHIATACLRQADELFTLEGTGKNPKMTALSGRIADRWDLTICAPRASMARLFPLRPSDTDKAATNSPDEQPPTEVPSIEVATIEKRDDEKT